MKLLVEDTYLEPSLWTWNQEPWTQLELDHSVNFSDLITSFSVSQEPETTGLRDITLRELNLLTQFSMSLERKLKVVIAYKDSRSPTPSEVVPDQVWEPSWSPRLEKSTQTELCAHSLLCHHQRYLIPSLSHTTLLYQSINSLKTLMRSCVLITRPSTISVSEPSSSPPPPMVI